MNDFDKARLVAFKAGHSSYLATGSLRFPSPLAVGLRMYDETIQVAVGLRLGLKLCEEHTCPCGALVSARGTHGLSCKRSAGRSTRHQHIIDLISRVLKHCDVPVTEEPSRLCRDYGKRPDGLTLVPWQNGRCLTWDATLVDSLASSYLSATSSLRGSAADAAAGSKRSKYAVMMLTHIFVPVAVETLGPVNAECLRFRIKLATGSLPLPGDPRESSLYQRPSVLVQRFNMMAFRGSFIFDTDIEA